MDNLDESVHQTDYFLTQRLNCFWELLDATHGEDNMDFATWNLELHEVFVICEGPRDYLCTFLPKATLE